MISKLHRLNRLILYQGLKLQLQNMHFPKREPIFLSLKQLLFLFPRWFGPMVFMKNFGSRVADLMASMKAMCSLRVQWTISPLRIGRCWSLHPEQKSLRPWVQKTVVNPRVCLNLYEPTVDHTSTIQKNVFSINGKWYNLLFEIGFHVVKWLPAPKQLTTTLWLFNIHFGKKHFWFFDGRIIYKCGIVFGYVLKWTSVIYCPTTEVLKPGAKTRWGFSQEICCERPPEIQWKAATWNRGIAESPSKSWGYHGWYTGNIILPL